MDNKILVVSGVALTDTVFTLMTVEPNITWNVTRLQAAVDAGRFGKPRTYPMEVLPPTVWTEGGLDRGTVDAIKLNPEALSRPVMMIESPPGDPFEFLCFVDGQHRIAARRELKLPDFSFYVIPHDAEKEFRVIEQAFDKWPFPR